MKKATRLKKEITTLIKLQSKTGDERQMQEFIINKYANRPEFKIKIEKGNIYIDKGRKKRKPLIVAHTDTVHSITSGQIHVTEVKGHLIALDNNLKQIGTGGDDKNGLFIAFQLLEQFNNIKAFFPAEEESGCTGTARADMQFFNNVTFAVQNDRQGAKDAVNEIGGLNLWSSEFKRDIEPILKAADRKITSGGITDVWQLAKMNINCSVINLSCNYYSPHTNHESIDFLGLLNTLQLNIEIFETLSATDKIYTHKATAKRQYRKAQPWKTPERNMFTSKTPEAQTAAQTIYRNVKQEIYAGCKDCGENLTNMKDSHNGQFFCISCNDYKTNKDINLF